MIPRNLVQKLRDMLFEKGFKRGTFTLASGKTSDFYIDVRSVALSADGHWVLGRILYNMVRYEFNTDVDAIAGVELGGCPLASAVSLMSVFDAKLAFCLTSPRPPMQLPALYIRKKAKGHGTGKLVESPAGVTSGKVILLEDVITTGGSTIRAANSLKKAGFNVVGVAVVVDRMENNARTIIEQELGCNVLPILTRHDFIPETP